MSLLTLRSEGKGLKLAIVGSFEGTHIAGSLARAAADLEIETILFDVASSVRGNRFLRTLCWRFCDHRPLRLGEFSAGIVAACDAGPCPDILIATGAAALNERAVRMLRSKGIFCINYSTDDPWNPMQRARWHLRALPAYNVVFTTRRANIDDLQKLGCTDARYLPFGYDHTLFGPLEGGSDGPSYDVVFVGGADLERVGFMRAFMREGPKVMLVGGYWDRYAATRPFALGINSPDKIRAITAAAKVNLCLVRRANRDGHVMRSFEIPAVSGCMLVEDTPEHRVIFGDDGDAVLYFCSAEDAAVRARALIADSQLRSQLAQRASFKILSGPNRYADRLRVMLQSSCK